MLSEQVIRGLSGWDYGIIAVYFVFILSIGWIQLVTGAGR